MGDNLFVIAVQLYQGTIAPDWIETEGEIKSHHNLALPSGMELELCEPIRDLYKDEVRVQLSGISRVKQKHLLHSFSGVATRLCSIITVF